MKASQIDIEKIIEKIDFHEIMNLQHFNDHGSHIYVWEDGDIEVMSQGTRPGNTDIWYALIDCFGRGNIDESTYAEGWAEEYESEDGSFGMGYIDIETGLVMTPDEMITKCLEDGDFTDSIEMLKDHVREQYCADVIWEDNHDDDNDE